MSPWGRPWAHDASAAAHKGARAAWRRLGEGQARGGGVCGSRDQSGGRSKARATNRSEKRVRADRSGGIRPSWPKHFCRQVAAQLALWSQQQQSPEFVSSQRVGAPWVSDVATGNVACSSCPTCVWSGWACIACAGTTCRAREAAIAEPTGPRATATAIIKVNTRRTCATGKPPNSRAESMPYLPASSSDNVAG